MDVFDDLPPVVAAEASVADDVLHDRPYCEAVAGDVALVVAVVVEVVVVVRPVQKDKQPLAVDLLAFDAEPWQPFDVLPQQPVGLLVEPPLGLDAGQWVVDPVDRNIPQLLPAYWEVGPLAVVHLVGRRDLVVVVVQTMRVVVVHIALLLLGKLLEVSFVQRLQHFVPDVRREAAVEHHH